VSRSGSASKIHKPDLDEMGIASWHEVKPARGKKVERPRKPTLDEMGPGTESKIFQPTSSRDSGPEFGPAPRSTGGAPGHRGGWKKR
jgi:excinuclease ABC subunit B